MLRHFNYKSVLPIPFPTPTPKNALPGMSIMLRGQKFTDNHFNFEHGAEDFI